MSMLALSRHAETRMRQRGMRLSDLDLILCFGSVIGGDSYDIYFLKDVVGTTIERVFNDKEEPDGR